MIWVGKELRSIETSVVHEPDFETLDFDVVLVGSLFKASLLLVKCYLPWGKREYNDLLPYVAIC